jgi:ABC-type amino acid transport system permease subunit
MSNYTTYFTLNDLLLMIQGAGITFFLTIASGIIGSLIGFLVGWARTFSNKVLYYLLGAYLKRRSKKYTMQL